MSHSEKIVKGKSFELFEKNGAKDQQVWYHDSRTDQ